MKILYFDAINGISGDMIISSLLSLDNSLEKYLTDNLNTLGLNVEFNIYKTQKMGISSYRFEVIEHAHNNHEHHHGHSHEHEHIHSGLSDILNLIENSKITVKAKETAKKIFTLLARAEAAVHNKSVEEIHFHEVGAKDSICDIVGAAVLIDKINPDKIMTSPIKEGRGFVNCAHGKIPVPVPAVLELFKIANKPFTLLNNENGETVTPTGAAICLSVSDEFGEMPKATILNIGYGAGKKDFDVPNVLRAVLAKAEGEYEPVYEIRTNIDDMTGEALSFAAEKLFGAGALDVWTEAIYMKKSRPAFCLNILAKKGDLEKIAEILFRETTTAGIRYSLCDRIIMDREAVEVDTAYGKVKVKRLKYKDIVKVIPEYESVRETANKNNIGFLELYETIKKNTEG